MRLALALALVLLPAVQSGSPDAHEHEWEIRRWALNLEESREQLSTALASEDWREKERGLAALARSVSPLTTEFEQACIASLESEHPSVKATALDALSSSGAIIDLSAELQKSLADERLPEVRAALARFIGRCGGDSALLGKLALDLDERVREDARAALFGQVGDAAAARLLERLVVDGELDELVRALDWSRRLRLSSDGGVAGIRIGDGVSRGRRALVSALELSGGSADRAVLDALLDGWFTGELEQRAARSLVEETARTLDEDSAGSLVELWMAVDRGESERWPNAVLDCRRLGEDSESRRDDLMRIAMNALGPEAVMCLVANAELSVEAQLSLLRFASDLLIGWDREIALRFLESGDVDIRTVCMIGLGRATSVGDVTSAQLLVEILESGTEQERKSAFEWLTDAPSIDPWIEALAAAWPQFNERTRFLLLRELPRGKPLVPFREVLIELGEQGGRERDAVFDLLIWFGADEEIAALFGSWVESEVRLALEGDLGGPSAAERRAAGALRAFARVSGSARSDDCDQLALRVLSQVGGSSEHISEVAIHLLGDSPNLLETLPELLEEPTDEQTRTRTAMALAPHGHLRANEVLEELLSSANWELSFQMLQALAETESGEARFWLAEAALDAGLRPAIRRSAVVELAATGRTAEVRDHLSRIALHGLDARTMTAAIDGLGRIGAGGKAALLSLLRKFEGGGDSNLAALEGDFREMVRIELLLALANLEAYPDELLSEVFERSMEAADDWLAYRLRGKETAKVEFVWREELQLFRRLAERRPPREILDASGEWWRMESRLLIRLAEVVEGLDPWTSDPELARELFEVGLGAVRGEARADVDYATRAQVGLLRVAVKAKEWDLAQSALNRLLGEWREGRTSERIWNSYLGHRDRLTHCDPPACLAALQFQLGARIALEAGRSKEARELANRASELVGFSAAALDVQSKLEAELGAKVQPGAGERGSSED